MAAGYQANIQMCPKEYEIKIIVFMKPSKSI